MAGLGLLPNGAPTPTWATRIRAANADEAASAAREAGGSVVVVPFDVPPVGRMAVIDDPAGARFVAWEADGREGAQVVNEPGAWSMSSLFTPDPDAAAAFYGSVFGWETMSFGPGISFFRLPGYVGGEPEQPVPRDVVATMSPSDGDAASWRPDLWIAEIEGAVAAAERLGGEVLEAPAEFPGAPFKTALLADPAGARFSVSRLLLAPAAA